MEAGTALENLRAERIDLEARAPRRPPPMRFPPDHRSPAPAVRPDPVARDQDLTAASAALRGASAQVTALDVQLEAQRSAIDHRRLTLDPRPRLGRASDSAMIARGYGDSAVRGAAVVERSHPGQHTSAHLLAEGYRPKDLKEP